MNTILQDLRYALRMLVKKPGFTLVAVITLALGIGANTAIFSVVDAILFKPLPYADSDRLVMVYGNFLGLNVTRTLASVPEFQDYREQASSFESLAAFDNFSANLTANDGGEPERVEALVVTHDLLSVLRVSPFKGRDFIPEDAQKGGDNVVLIGHSLWQRRFGGDTNLIGNDILVNGRTHTVVGVMPAGFAFPAASELWKPFSFPQELFDQNRRGSRGLTVIGRLKSNVSLTEAQSEMDTIAARFEQQYPQHYKPSSRWKVSLVPLLDEFIGDVRLALFVLLGAVAFVLLIACANVATLLLARAAARRQEMAVRLALGATRARIVRQLLTESVLLALAGGTLGLLLAVWGVDLLLKFTTDNVPRIHEVSLDGRVLAFTFVVSLLTGILFGLAPALTLSRPEIQETLREGGRCDTGSTNRRRLHNVFVTAEIALALVLLIGAGLMLRSFWLLRKVDPGFNPDGVLTMRLMLPYATYPQQAGRAAFYRQALEHIKALPGVEAVGAATRIPLTEQGKTSATILGENSAAGPSDLTLEADFRLVTPDYFEAMGIALVAGRPFTEGDTEGAPHVAIVDESFARRFWPGEDAVGKRVKRGDFNSTSPWMTVVGVVRQVKTYRLDSPSRVQIYFPFFQDPSPFNMSLAVRTSVAAPLTLTGAVREAIQSVDRNQPVFDVKTLRQIVDESIGQQRLSMLLLGIFAAVALLLAAAGIYGVMSYVVAGRTHEIGIRMALGAQRRDILYLVVGKGLILTLLGVGLGLAGAFSLTRLMSRLLFGVTPTDPVTFGIVTLVLMGIALVACFIPARRATKVDPMVALRYE